MGLIYLLQGDNDKFKLSYGLDILDKEEVEALPILFLENIIPEGDCHLHGMRVVMLICCL